ncbi:MAG: homoserine dehydrogenase [Candidatus Odyssella sp.]|nr:homoserine dehydrogenase [Candidatus Odyssella sp.]
MSAPLKIAVAGLGTVGAGLVKLLASQAALLEARCGRRLVVTAVAARDRHKQRDIDISKFAWFDDPVEMARSADADAVVELIGGADGPAKALAEAAFARKRHVVTANKAMLAHHGAALAAAAERAGVTLGYEAAVAGGIPIVKALREGLAGNRIQRVYGILNGTCNYILTVMRESGRSFADVLADAQKMGYAEADPSLDVDGVDTAHKLAVLASLAFGTAVDFDAVSVAGIRNVSPMDLEYAGELGFRIKLLAIGRRTAKGIEQRVHPCMIPAETALARVDGVFNAVMVDGDFAGNTVYVGRGAGQNPTASAVASDLVDLARGARSPAFGVPAAKLAKLEAAPMAEHRGRYYIRLMVRDQPGVIADVSAALRDERVSMESMLQRGRSETKAVPVVLTTHETVEAAMLRALDRIGRLDSVIEPPCMIRIEEL